MNRWMGTGRLTADPEIMKCKNGKAGIRFRLAVPRRYSDKESGEKITDFFDVVGFSHTAKFVHNYCKKGDRILVEGWIQSYSKKGDDGSFIIRCSILAEYVEGISDRASLKKVSTKSKDERFELEDERFESEDDWEF